MTTSDQREVTWTMAREDAHDLLGWLRHNRPLGMPDRTFEGLVFALAAHQEGTEPCVEFGSHPRGGHAARAAQGPPADDVPGTNATRIPAEPERRPSAPHRPMAVTEFLLTRIAEDEAAAVQQRYYSDIRSAEIGGRLVGTSARVLAECEAKRRIVEHAIATWPEDETRWALLILAAVYADHPDYDEAWRA